MNLFITNCLQEVNTLEPFLQAGEVDMAEGNLVVSDNPLDMEVRTVVIQNMTFTDP